MFESKFFSPLKALKRPGDIVALLLLCASLCATLGYSLYANSTPMPWAAISLLLVSCITGSYLIANYSEKDGWGEWRWVGCIVFMGSLLLAAFVDPAWLPFAWLLPLEFLMRWEWQCRGHLKKAQLSVATWSWSLVAIGIHSTYQVVHDGHWSLWLPAGIFALACGVGIAKLLHIGIELVRAWLRQRRESRKRERTWKHDKPVIDVLLPIFREFTTEWGYEGYLRAHEKHDLRKEDLLTLIDGSLRGLKIGHERALCDRDRNARDAYSLRQQLETTESALNQHLVGRVKLGKLVFEILARLRGATAPVDEGTLANWRRDIGFELVASHLLDLHPNAFEGYLANWPVSGAFIKALLRHDHAPVTGYPSLPDEWRRVLWTILVANTIDESAAPSAPAPAP